MMATALLYLEAALWMPDGSNMLSISGRLLGKSAKITCGILFLFLYNSLMVAYFSGGIPLLMRLLPWEMPLGLLYLLVALILGGVVFAGTRVADRLNFLLISGLIITYLLMTGAGMAGINLRLLLHRSWPYALLGVPTLIGAYGFHNIVPTLSTYLRRDPRKLRLAIVIGSSIPFLIYTIWQALVMGTATPDSLQTTVEGGVPINEQLHSLTNPLLAWSAQYFALFALVTSILGVSLSMVDFLGDGLKMSRRGKGRLLLCLITFAPPLLLAWSLPGLFFIALSYAGGFGEAILNGLFPILMVWIGRYKLGLHSDWKMRGGRPLLTLLLLGVAAIVTIRLWELAR